MTTPEQKHRGRKPLEPAERKTVRLTIRVKQDQNARLWKRWNASTEPRGKFYAWLRDRLVEEEE